MKFNNLDMMVTLNQNAKLQVLVCDNGGNNQYNGSTITYSTTNAVAGVLGSRADITRVDSLETATKEIMSRDRPHYALFVISSDHIKKGYGGMKIHEIKCFNPFLPQLIYGTDISRSNLVMGMRRGIRYDAEDQQQLATELMRIFYNPQTPIKNLTVAKFGGSSFDFDRQNPGTPNLRYVAEKIAEIKRVLPTQKNSKKGKNSPKPRIIATVGAGPLGDDIKDYTRNHDKVRAKFGNLIAAELDINLKKLACLMPDDSYKLLEIEDFYFINKNNMAKVALMGIAPHYILARDGIPLEDSDTHTIAIAELFGAKRVVLIKRADGIYSYDPNIGGFTSDFERWRRYQINNRRHPVVTVEDMLSGRISREGTNTSGERDGTLGHLMEDSGLEYFAGCKNVEEILVVHIAPEEMYIPAGENEFEHAVVPSESLVLNPAIGWKGILEQRIDDAFNGIALSKIVRSR